MACETRLAVIDESGAVSTYREVARLNCVLHANVPEAEVFDLEVQLHRLSGAGFDGDFGEALELDVGHLDTADDIFDVELYDLGSVACRVVRHIHGDRDGVLGRGGGLGDFQVRVFESATIQRDTSALSPLQLQPSRDRRGWARTLPVGQAIAKLAGSVS